uniref:Bud22 domain-containing protein n=1 Tax=Spumella elongata TaxID=89044 RepID=A0A7S3GS18_9STRA
MSTTRHYGSAKKTAKPTEEVLKSRIYQAVKAVSKAVKIVKTFLVLKSTKKLASLREGLKEGASNDKIENELGVLEMLRGLDHGAVAATIVRLKVAFGNDPKYNPMSVTTDSAISPELLKTIMNHKRVEDTIVEIQSKITTTIEKNNELRAKEQSKSATQKAKSLFSKKNGSGYVDGTKAVFMDSLDDPNEGTVRKEPTARDLVKLNKSLRNQANRMKNRANNKTEEPSNSAPEYERSGIGNHREHNDPSLHMYRPLDQRFPSSSSSASAPKNASGGRNNNKGNTRSGDNKNSGGRGGNGADQRRVGAPPSRPKSAPAVPIMPSAELTKAASFGKEWKTTGVHPSWAAKQHAKQQSVGAIPSAATGAAGQGKKIVFDD